ncbi:NADH dehydrogenase, partial [Intrasporangium chromatireducens Q5-1]
MPDLPVTVSAAWAPLAAALLGLLALGAAALDGAIGARAEQLPWSRGMGRPLDESARLLRQRRRSMVAADTLLWRVGASGLVVAALLMVVVVPLGRWTLLDLDVGVVWFNAVDVLVWALVWLAGWGPNS